MDSYDIRELKRCTAEIEPLLKADAAEFLKWSDAVKTDDQFYREHALCMGNYHRGRAEAFTTCITAIKERFKEVLKEGE